MFLVSRRFFLRVIHAFDITFSFHGTQLCFKAKNTLLDLPLQR